MANDPRAASGLNFVAFQPAHGKPGAWFKSASAPTPDFCNVASGWEKGVVEKNMQDSRRRIWIQAAKQRFGSFAELNAWLADRCRALWDEVRHPERDQFTVAEMLDLERPHLLPMTMAFDGHVEKPARVSSTCLVSVARNRYSVPSEWTGQIVSTRLYPGQEVIVADDKEVARHARLSNAGETRYDWQHYVPRFRDEKSSICANAWSMFTLVTFMPELL